MPKGHLPTSFHATARKQRMSPMRKISGGQRLQYKGFLSYFRSLYTNVSRMSHNRRQEIWRKSSAEVGSAGGFLNISGYRFWGGARRVDPAEQPPGAPTDKLNTASLVLSETVDVGRLPQLWSIRMADGRWRPAGSASSSAESPALAPFGGGVLLRVRTRTRRRRRR